MSENGPGMVDARGQACPMPVIRLARAVAEVDIGEAVVLLADDVAAKADVPAWCRMKGQDLDAVVEEDGAWAFTVRRRS